MFELISTWLKQCSEGHELCQQASPPKLPLRVIDVSRDDPFLLETDGQSGHYFALSYCWGKQRLVDMMSFGPNSKGKRGQPDPKSNIESHKLRIPYAAMPKTLQDAVIVSRRLKIRYLWIDALCIIQGDDEEWEREHLRMADIYSSAKLVLAADNADGLEKGFLETALDTSGSLRDWSSRSKAKVREESLGLRREGDLCPSPLSLDEPLNRRAWSLSETIFANRVVHFTSSGVIWECNEARHYDRGFSHIFHEHNDDSFRVFRSEKIAKRSSKDELYRKWNLLVAEFTKRQINSQPGETYKDAERLVALSRLARRFSWILSEVHQCEDQYLAGMWRGDLEASLLWSVESCLQEYPEMRWRRPGTSRAPSWSWAAIEGSISIEPFISVQSHVLIEEATVKYQSKSDPFGRVFSGSLVVRGKILHNICLQLEDKSISTYPTGHVCKHLGKTPDDSYTFILDSPLSQQELSHRFSCLFLGEVGVAANDREHERVHCAILLLRVVPVAPSTFERVGISSYRSQDTSTLESLNTMKIERVTIV